jgi:uncharacterized protein YjlB
VALKKSLFPEADSPGTVLQNPLISAIEGKIQACVAERSKAERGPSLSCIRPAVCRKNIGNNYGDDYYYYHHYHHHHHL